jgi:ribonucleoside-diphosphate reductase alpha chain
MQLDGIRQKVFSDRYALKDKNGTPTEQSPEDMWRRIARFVATNEKKEIRDKWEEQFYQAMTDFRLVPGGRILSGAGTGYNVTFYNCFVIPSPKDSRTGILHTLNNMVEIMARGGGVGINLSSLRPRGARVKKVNGFSSGPCNWAELFSVATKDIIQQGGTRRGALMLMLWDWHPDVEEFIRVKQDLRRINGANLSVCVSDKFMDAVKKDEDWQLVFPDKSDPEYDEKWDGYLPNWIALGKKVIVHKTVKARFIWDMIADAAWRSAEPGVVFLERYNKWFNNYYYEYVNCVNPCGEEGLPNWGVCNLCSINLAALVDDKAQFNYDLLTEISKIGVRFQDNIIDLDQYVFPEIEDVQKNGERRIGLGTMGLGDALIKMKLRYGSEESLKVIHKIYKTIRNAAYDASIELSRDKGSFPKIDKKKHVAGYFVKQLPDEMKEKLLKYGIRNSVILQQAPTGSTSLLAGVSSGIEPVFEFEFIRRDRLGEHILQHPLYEEWVKEYVSIHGKKPEKKDRPDWFVSANDLTPEDHVRVQAAVQKYVDASISKTVNAPQTHTVDDVKRLYTLAYDLGCKGIAYMREGSRPAVLTRTDSEKKVESEKKELQIPEIPKIKSRPMVVHGSTYQVNTPVGQAFVTINTNGGNQPLEMFVNVGKAGSDVTAMAEALGRIVSLLLRIPSTMSETDRAKRVAAQLVGIGGARSMGFGENRIRSLPDAIAKVIDRHFNIFAKQEQSESQSHDIHASHHPEGNGMSHAHNLDEVVHEELPLMSGQQALPLEKSVVTVDYCPSCGAASLVFEESCKKCYSCGYSEC